jgi:hypothetical protein
VDDQQLIDQYIELDPQRPTPDEAILKGTYPIKVWAIVGHYLYTVGEKAHQVAEDYGVPEEAVHAALAWYKRYESLIDNRLSRDLNPPSRAVLMP